MESSDDITAIKVPDNSDRQATAPQTDVASACAPKCDGTDGDGVEQKSEPQNGGSNIGEYAAFSIKVVAVVLSLVVMLTCIIAFGAPLAAMRVFNKLGMSERAVDFAERYIRGRLDDGDADVTDELGNYVRLAATTEFTDADMTEALYVCNDLSYRLMEDYYASGDTARGAYYAERLEKYTRMYMSLGGIADINKQKSVGNMDAMPSVMMRPMVYNYAHDIRVTNFRARAYLGKTDRMLFDSRSEGRLVTTTTERTNTFNNEQPLDGLTRSSLIALLDDYVDYVGQIDEYLDVEFKRAGVNRDPFGKVVIDGREMIYMTETAVRTLYTDKLNGSEFSLFLSRESGNFTYLYNTLKKFSKYAQAAVDFVPASSGDIALDERIHQLYWLQAFSSVSSKMWYMSQLLYYNRDNFGILSSAIAEEYSASTCEKYTWVDYGGVNQIWGVYTSMQNEYFKTFIHQGEVR